MVVQCLLLGLVSSVTPGSANTKAKGQGDGEQGLCGVREFLYHIWLLTGVLSQDYKQQWK